jgi:anti-sigma factor RsiW
MNDKTAPDTKSHARSEHWEEQINALLDGELDDEQAKQLKAAAEQDKALARAIIEAYQLQQALEAIPLQRAPASLRRKLADIPAGQGREKRAKTRAGWFQPAWIGALAAIPLVLIAVSLWKPAEVATTAPLAAEQAPPTAAELREARQELAVAFEYLGKVGRKTGLEIGTTVNTEMQQTINQNMIQTIQDQMQFNKERNA